jgi:hypothetical protein
MNPTGVKPGSRARHHDLQTKREFRPKVSKPLTRFGNDSFSRPKRVFETVKVARTACLRLGESAECVERVEGTLEAEPGEVAEGDACYRRMNPPQSPTQSIDWCGVVEPSIFALTGPPSLEFLSRMPRMDGTNVCRQKEVRLQHHPVDRHHRRRSPRARLFRARAAPVSGAR